VLRRLLQPQLTLEHHRQVCCVRQGQAG
jgi:hypothetical protein